MPDFSSLMQEGCFTFLVGPEKQRFDFHVGAIKNVSNALYQMITNGVMSESIQKVASLKDVDPATFIGFGQWLYTRYLVSVDKNEEGNKFYGLKGSFFFCNRCRASNSVLSHATWFPKCSYGCVKQHAIYCVVCGAGTPTAGGPLCAAHAHLDKNHVGPTQPQVSSESLWGKFVAQKFGGEGMDHDQLAKYLKVIRPDEIPTEELVAHAKLFVFADTYLIKDLKDVCLHKLFINLCSFEITESNVEEVVELAAYTYANTSSDTNEGSEPCKLRQLVLSYISCKGKTLLGFELFRAVLIGGGDLVADFTAQLAVRLPAD